MAPPQKNVLSERRRKSLRRANLKFALKKRGVNITIDEYETMLATVTGCAICGRVPETHMHLDHCHITGQIRGFLCSTCNQGLGLFNDDPSLLQAAMEYLEKNHG